MVYKLLNFGEPACSSSNLGSIVNYLNELKYSLIRYNKDKEHKIYFNSFFNYPIYSYKKVN